LPILANEGKQFRQTKLSDAFLDYLAKCDPKKLRNDPRQKARVGGKYQGLISRVRELVLH
jgi:hypothetical protein